jgi:hypothetical protein
MDWRECDRRGPDSWRNALQWPAFYEFSQFYCHGANVCASIANARGFIARDRTATGAAFTVGHFDATRHFIFCP